MVAEDLFIVAIELGSSNVTGIAGKKMPDGTISVEALVQEPSSAFIRRGMILNLTKSSQCVASIIERLTERLKRPIKQVYVGYGGQSVRSKFNTVSKPLSGEKITKEDVDSLLNENFNMNLGNCVILDEVPQEYMTGKDKTIDPVGFIAERVEARYLNIIARNSLKSNIETCFSDAHISVAGYMLTPLCEANLVLTEADKRSGCVFVDFGAETTSVAIYRDNILRYVSVIPLGSANITSDIESLQLDKTDAEHLKINQSSADNSEMTVEQGKEVICALPDNSNLDKATLGNIVEARMKEILANVSQQIKDSGFDKNSLLSGAILTGGGSNLKGLLSAFAKTVGITQVKLVKSLPNVNFSKVASLKVREDRLVDAVSLIAEGTQPCCGPKVEDGTNMFTTSTPMDNANNESTPEGKDEGKHEAENSEGPSKKSKFLEKFKKLAKSFVEDE